MAKIVYIHTSYNGGIAIPMELLPYLDKIKLVKHEGYNNIKNPTWDTDPVKLEILDSNLIGKAERDAEYLKDLETDRDAAQARIDRIKAGDIDGKSDTIPF